MNSRSHPKANSAWPNVADSVRKVMRGNTSKDTVPERTVRSLVHQMGYRYRKNYRALAGTPDLAFIRRRKVIWVHGCFWHSHAGCPLGAAPRSRTDYWLPKLARNKARDLGNSEAMRAMGWQSIVVWECELKDVSAVRAKLRKFLGPRGPSKTDNTLRGRPKSHDLLGRRH